MTREIFRTWRLLQNTFKIKNLTFTMGKVQLTDTEKAKIIKGRDQGLTIQELSTKFGRTLSTVSVLLQRVCDLPVAIKKSSHETYLQI